MLTSPCPAKTMSDRQKKIVALNVLSKKTPVTDIAKHYDVSRQFIYRQKGRAISAVDDAFVETSDGNEKILFHLPVTKALARDAWVYPV